MGIEKCSSTCSHEHTLIRDQLRLIPARIEGVKIQATKYEINIRFLETFGFESIAADANSWKRFTNEQVGPSS